jgi:hypothetical protein
VKTSFYQFPVPSKKQIFSSPCPPPSGGCFAAPPSIPRPSVGERTAKLSKSEAAQDLRSWNGTDKRLGTGQTFSLPPEGEEAQKLPSVPFFFVKEKKSKNLVFLSFNYGIRQLRLPNNTVVRSKKTLVFVRIALNFLFKLTFYFNFYK